MSKQEGGPSEGGDDDQKSWSDYGKDSDAGGFEEQGEDVVSIPNSPSPCLPRRKKLSCLKIRNRIGRPVRSDYREPWTAFFGQIMDLDTGIR